MIKKEMSTESVSPEPHLPEESKLEEERMINYKKFSVAFSYPEGKFFELFTALAPEKEKLIFEYDRLFRAEEVWLYGEEYIAKTEFQRANNLADIMGFYRAFGLEPEKERPDSLPNELEFMHYLIFKKIYALKNRDTAGAKKKASICLDAQRKFFTEHLYPGAVKMSEAIIGKTKNDFYLTITREMLEFLEGEKRFLKGNDK